MQLNYVIVSCKPVSSKPIVAQLKGSLHDVTANAIYISPNAVSGQTKDCFYDEFQEVVNRILRRSLLPSVKIRMSTKVRQKSPPVTFSGNSALVDDARMMVALLV